MEHFAFLPQTLTVSRGTTVTFTMTPSSREIHTATAGPGPATNPKSYIGALASSFTTPVIAPGAIYPSQPPGTLSALTPSLHGNGFWNGGPMDAEAATQLPFATRVRFNTAGTYNFYCLVHPFMHGVVVVR